MGIPDDICGLCYRPKDSAETCKRHDCESSALPACSNAVAEVRKARDECEANRICCPVPGDLNSWIWASKRDAYQAVLDMLEGKEQHCI